MQPYKINLTEAQYAALLHFLPKGYFLKRQKGKPIKSKTIHQDDIDPHAEDSFVPE